MPDQVLLMMLRRTTWLKAKGQLLSILEFYSSAEPQGLEDFEEMQTKIEDFIEWMERESPIA